jgi:PAS domain-containing protein
MAPGPDAHSDRWQLPDWLVDAEAQPSAGDKRMSIETLSAGLSAWSPATPAQPEQGDLIQASWVRSKEAGLAPEMVPDFSGANDSHIKGLLEESRQLGSLAYPVMQALHEQIANTHSTVVLTDGAGRILYSMGDDSFLERAEKVALKPGVDWSEAAKGTNAVGTAIALQRPITVHAEQHFLTANQFLTCSSTPIFNPRGTVAGVLDVSGDARGYHRHTMALARMSAQIIENQIFSQTYQHAIRLHFHSRPEFIGTLFEGMVAFSRGGRFLAANRGAMFQVGLDRSALERQTLSSLFGLPIDELIDHCRSSNPGLLSLSLPSGLTVRAKAEIQGHVLWTVAGLAPGAKAGEAMGGAPIARHPTPKIRPWPTRGHRLTQPPQRQHHRPAQRARPAPMPPAATASTCPACTTSTPATRKCLLCSKKFGACRGATSPFSYWAKPAWAKSCWPKPYTTTRPARPTRLWPSTARPFPKASSSLSCLATTKGPSPGPSAKARWARFNWPTAARCFWTKSATCP